ncbi:uncharacterized protein PRCAT00000206001 [Priceomyces carsonii]|uniref:uncharacterized protein n=1 Tax=Priceomyces carsonii TaxID=28549 RepID=UPI002EDAEBDE|nr:unnamed protein product [Priceomyces carsonii]
MEFIKLIKLRISPGRNSEANASTLVRKRKTSRSEDDPFFDPESKSRKLVLSEKNVKDQNDGSYSIRNTKLSKPSKNNKATSFLPSKGIDDQKDVQQKMKNAKYITRRLDEAQFENENHEEDEVTLEVLEEMSKLVEYFPVLSLNYRLIDKIGEGTFSTVYKAEALNGTIKLGSDVWRSPPLRKKKNASKRKNPIVALKQIYVTSSPNRIHNELNLLYILTGNSHVAPLLDVLRYQDQVLAILPYYQHSDFRDFYRDLPIKGIKKYLWELFQALDFVHDKDVIHRDLKPTNFLYDPFKGHGVLVDFGLAEKVQNNKKASNPCPCESTERIAKGKRLSLKGGYPKQDLRPPRRANRAGTRGFRAPEVLFKCTNQNTKLDIWSAGIIGLSIILRKFPLFNSPDDTDAILELALVFGIEKLQKCAELHGCGLEIDLEHMQTDHVSILQLICIFLRYEWDNESFPKDSVVWDTLKLFNKEGDKLIAPKEGTPDNFDNFQIDTENYEDHKNLIELLNGCFQMDPKKRMSAKYILKLPFFEELKNKQEDEVLF